jgi:protein SCO1/2
MNTPRKPLNRTGFGKLLRVALALSLGLAACAPPEEEANRYDLKGKVVSVDRARGEVVVDHEDIEGYMPSMQMPFPLKDRDALASIEGGDQIQATLVVAESGYWLENPVVTKGIPGGEAAAAAAAGPPAGTEVPDFTFVNQDGRRLDLRQLRGRALLLTFIYTRCPVPDYCPLMSSNFAAVHRALEQDEGLRGKAHLLSVTLDPAYDTPKVLRSYGAGYTERYGAETFEHWDFATGDPGEIRRLAQFFGLAYSEEKGQVIHSLRTALVDSDGKVYKIYRGNEWKPEQVLGDLRTLTAETRP